MCSGKTEKKQAVMSQWHVETVERVQRAHNGRAEITL